MTRTQIAAKSVLTGLMVYAVVLLTRPLSALPYLVAPNVSPAPLAVFVCTLLLVSVGIRVVCIDGWLLPKAAPDDEILSPAPARRLLAQSLRLTMIALGLLLLRDAIWTLVGYLKTLLVLRGLITEAIVDRGIPRDLHFSAVEWIGGLCDFANALLVLYLLCGAPRFVRWQVTRVERVLGSCTKA